MASIDFQEPGRFRRADLRPQFVPAGPRPDGLGVLLFALHALVGLGILTGWAVPSKDFLGLYLVLLPLVALQWRLNRGSCVLNNFESLIRTGTWRDPESREEGAFLLMVADWLLKTRPSVLFLNRLSYGTVLVLWLLGCAHLVAIVAM